MRFLCFTAQKQLSLDEFYPNNPPKYLTGDQRIDMRFLLGEFQQFWREHSVKSDRSGSRTVKQPRI